MVTAMGSAEADIEGSRRKGTVIDRAGARRRRAVCRAAEAARLHREQQRAVAAGQAGDAQRKAGFQFGQQREGMYALRVEQGGHGIAAGGDQGVEAVRHERAAGLPDQPGQHPGRIAVGLRGRLQEHDASVGADLVGVLDALRAGGLQRGALFMADAVGAAHHDQHARRAARRLRRGGARAELEGERPRHAGRPGPQTGVQGQLRHAVVQRLLAAGVQHQHARLAGGGALGRARILGHHDGRSQGRIDQIQDARGARRMHGVLARNWRPPACRARTGCRPASACPRRERPAPPPAAGGGWRGTRPTILRAHGRAASSPWSCKVPQSASAARAPRPGRPRPRRARGCRCRPTAPARPNASGRPG